MQYIQYTQNLSVFDGSKVAMRTGMQGTELEF